ncbi:DUF2922 family protein [Enterococcus pallens]|uniref:DUF2922 family protein n=1 Tax=Enterococcus pallens ATCC BAA-351 TaxID=1158607 RepID=R2Q6B2_9ENTE|nr:DUF2922 family protein [Enterococcus pallens]EOH90803.1 hypothetical protein UAU_03342 [Enterococcus pallens ATCC BAA-351]EOU15999.1 hypothetical protein I588_03655 [Enterococcus pallens ATCC BAA-351]OJG76006.1 hypothetical protein RV10_GL004462 [Enterococcus pallens]
MPETKLLVRFKTEADKIQTWRYNEPDTTKTPAQIKANLEELTTLNLFKKDGIRQFFSVESAEFVTTLETPIF